MSKRTIAKSISPTKIKVLTPEEAAALPWDANWIGTLGEYGGPRSYLKTRKQAEAWVRRVLPNWPGQWAVYQALHCSTGESLGWGATAL